MDQRLTTAEAAAVLGVNTSRIRQLIIAGQLPAEKLGRDWFMDRADVLKLIGRRPGRPRKDK